MEPLQFVWTWRCVRAGLVRPSVGVYSWKLRSKFSSRKSVTGPLSRFLRRSDIWCPVRARMPPLHCGRRFWCRSRASISAHTHAFTHTHQQTPHTPTWSCAFLLNPKLNANCDTLSRFTHMRMSSCSICRLQLLGVGVINQTWDSGRVQQTHRFSRSG